MRNFTFYSAEGQYNIIGVDGTKYEIKKIIVPDQML